MPEEYFKEKRLFVEDRLSVGASPLCSTSQTHYLIHVLRLKEGDKINVFNGYDGEWCARLKTTNKKCVSLEIQTQLRVQTKGQDIDYLFAPLKHARLDYMVQKATEMGVGRLCPVLTHHTIVERINLKRMRANTIEAAEQCGLLFLPELKEPQHLFDCFNTWDQNRHLIFCDETAVMPNPLSHLRDLKGQKLGVLIGPEGGFSKEEREFLRKQAYTHSISLGPRILRADTAAIAALSLVNAILGDWT